MTYDKYADLVDPKFDDIQAGDQVVKTCGGGREQGDEQKLTIVSIIFNSLNTLYFLTAVAQCARVTIHMNTLIQRKL